MCFSFPHRSKRHGNDPQLNYLPADVQAHTSYMNLPEVAIVMVDYDPDWEVGRCALYHRNTATDGKTAQPYVIDPYPHVDAKLHLRVGTADVNALPPSWYIGVTQMAKTAAK